MKTPAEFAPHSVEAEEALLGGLLHAPDMLNAVRNTLTAEDFFLVKHGVLYRAMCRSFDDHGTFNAVTLGTYLNGELPGLEGMLYSLEGSTPTAIYSEVYAELVRRFAVRRALVNAAQEVVKLANDSDLDITETLNRAQAAIFAVGQGNCNGIESFDSVLSEVFDDLERARSGKQSTLRIPTPWLGLNKMIGGLEGQQLIIPAARPGNGKSAMMLQIATHAARQGHAVLYISMEMGSREMMSRVIAQDLNVPTRIQDQMDDKQWEQFVAWIHNRAPALRGLSFETGKSGTMTPMKALSLARDMRRRGQCDLLIVDYLQLMTADRPSGKRHDELGTITRSLKQLAMELDIPVIAASQLNRDAAKGDQPPHLHQLRDSGALESDANMVIFIHDPNPPEEGDTIQSGPKKFIIAKNRNGKTGTVPVVWMGDRVMFGDMDTTGRAEDAPAKKAIKTVKTVKPGEVVGMKGTKDD